MPVQVRPWAPFLYLDRKMKIINYVKTILFGIIGVLILIFSKKILGETGENLFILVGSAMILFALGLGAEILIEKENKNLFLIVRAFILLILGLFVLIPLKFISDSLKTICYVWAIWSLLRETIQTYINIKENFKVVPVTSILCIIESIILAVFSILLLIEPGLHHAYSHILLLGVEFVLEGAFPNIANSEKQLRNK